MAGNPCSGALTSDKAGDVTIGGGDGEGDPGAGKGADDVGVGVEYLDTVNVGLRLKERCYLHEMQCNAGFVITCAISCLSNIVT